MPRKLNPRPHLNKEIELLAAGYSRIAGVDEVGNGSWAGPIVVAAVMLPLPSSPSEAAAMTRPVQTLLTRLEPVLDSKRVQSDNRRKSLYELILSVNPIYQLGIINVDELNLLKNNTQAALLGSQRAIQSLPYPPDYVLFDNGLAPSNFPLPHEQLVKGDVTSLSIACASILAQFTYDSIMREYDQQYSGYLFAKHKGYTTPEHKNLLHQLGPCPAHRSYHKDVKNAAKVFKSNHPDA